MEYAISPAPRWLRELADGRAKYEELLGWPVSVQVGNRVLALAVGDAVDGVSMPADLAARVRDELTIAMLRGPVVAAPDGGRWTFLTKPLPRLRSSISTGLAARRVALAPHGGHILIPTEPETTTRGRRWIEPPAPTRALPPAYAVIAITRRLTEAPPLAIGA